MTAAEMSSLADEIEKLYGMFQKDILTAEEFKEAKAAAMAKHRAAASASGGPSTPAEAPKATPSAPPIPPAVGEEEERQPAPVANLSQPSHQSLAKAALRLNFTGFEETNAGLHKMAYNHLMTIFKNILQYPTEAKFRKLKLNNQKLKEELFVSPGVIPLLESIGWEKFDANQPVVVAQVAAVGGVPLVPGEGEVYILNGAPDVPLLNAAIHNLAELQNRDAANEAAIAQYTDQRKSLGMTIRRERWVEANSRGEIMEHVATEVLRNHLDDAMDMVNVLKRILTNIVNNPKDPKFRVLKATNATVRSFMAAFGSLEFLCAVVGFVLENDGLRLPEDRTVDAVQKFIDNQLKDLETTVQRRIDAENEIRQKMAAAEAIKERNAYKREEQRAIDRQKGGPKPLERPASSSGKRVPISEALKYLLGEGPHPLKKGQPEAEGEEVAPPAAKFDIRDISQPQNRKRPNSGDEAGTE